MSKIICFLNQKGGVGKTTSVINISACLAENNFKTLIIDMDPQANSSQVYYDISDSDPSIYDLLIQRNKKTSQLTDIIKKTYINNLDIIPANVLLSSAEIDLVNIHGRETVLKRLISKEKKIFNDYDYILLDCPPSLGLLTVNSIMASNHLMIPLHADIFSLTGLTLLIETVNKLQTIFETKCTILGFFFTQVVTNQSMFKEAFELCKENYNNDLFDTYIRNNSAIDHANATAQSVIHFAPQSISSLDYQNITKELISKT